MREFLAEVRDRSVPEGGFVAIVEVCGFNDWLLKLLAEYGCRETILIQPEKRSKKKTDRRDANALGGDALGEPAAAAGRQARCKGSGACSCRPARRRKTGRSPWLRKRLGQQRTRTINRIKHILRKHNLEQECPTKGLDTIKGRKWLAELALAAIDRLEMDQLLAQWELWDEQIDRMEIEIQKRQPAARRPPCWPRSQAAGPMAAWRWRRGSVRSSVSRGRAAWRTIGA